MMRDYAVRLDSLRERLATAGLDAALIGIGPDLEYLTGYRAQPLERLTMLVVRPEPPATMVVPVLEAMHFDAIEDVIHAYAWEETEDPIGVVSGLIGGAASAAVSDETWARFVVDLMARLPRLDLTRAAPFTAELRMRKSADEIDALREVGVCVDEVITAIQAGEVALIGRTERDVAKEVSRRLLDAGHDSVEFHIVASGPNAASPHHEPGNRVIGANEIVLFDIGGRRNGYSSDTTRCVVTGAPPPDAVEAYAVLEEAQRAAVASAMLGGTCEGVDRAARRVIDDGGWGGHFIHRTGHGIGLAVHEEPYMVEGNDRPLEIGFSFSVEPGIYLAGRWGMRIEDIVVVTGGDPIRCNLTTTELIQV